MRNLYSLATCKGISPYYDLATGTKEIEDISRHFALRNDLIDHLWMRKGHNM